MIKDTGFLKDAAALNSFVNICRSEFDTFADNVDRKALQEAADIIKDSKSRGGRLHFTGIGKPSYVAGYAASLFSSVGTPAYYLHGTEAVHGSCGQLREGDVVVCISNSGETSELKVTAEAIKRNGARIIAVTGNKDSSIAKMGEVCIFAGVNQEGGVLNRAPRASILAELFVLQCLSVLVQEDVGLTPAQYVLRHPGGTLGHLRENEK